MLCDSCHDEEAVLHIKEVMNSKVRTLHLCRKCAEMKGLEGGNLPLDLSTLISNLAAELLPEPPAVGDDEGDESEVSKGIGIVCKSCGISSEDFRRTHRLGCATCYKTFGRILKTRWEQMHRGTSHVGHVPSGDAARSRRNRYLAVRLSELQEELDRAIATEEYEEAARLRDKISRIDAGREGAE